MTASVTPASRNSWRIFPRDAPSMRTHLMDPSVPPASLERKSGSPPKTTNRLRCVATLRVKCGKSRMTGAPGRSITMRSVFFLGKYASSYSPLHNSLCSLFSSPSLHTSAIFWGNCLLPKSSPISLSTWTSRARRQMRQAARRRCQDRRRQGSVSRSAKRSMRRRTSRASA